MNRQHRFTGRQITTMIVAVSAAAVLAPVGAVAATGALVNLTDPITPAYKARVTSAGSLAVTPRDPVSKVQARIDAFGHQLVSGNVTLTGRPDVTTHAGIPGTPFTAWKQFTSGGAGYMDALPSGKTLVIESVSIEVLSATQGGVEVKLTIPTHGTSGTLFVAPKQAYYDGATYSYYAETLSTKAYADPGSQIFAAAYGPTAINSLIVTISGYLI